MTLLPQVGSEVTINKYIYNIHIPYIYNTYIYTYAHTFCVRFFCIIIYHRILHIVLCALQEDLVYPSYTQLLASNPSTPPSPSTSTTRFSTSVSLFLFRRRDHLCRIQIPHISDLIRCLSFSALLTSLSMILSRYIHVAANGIISFFYTTEQYFIVYVYHIVFTQ